MTHRPNRYTHMNYLSPEIRQLLLLNYAAPNLNSSLVFFTHWEDNLLEREQELAQLCKLRNQHKPPSYSIPSVNID